jgi:hypothetical protein
METKESSMAKENVASKENVAKENVAKKVLRRKFWEDYGNVLGTF